MNVTVIGSHLCPDTLYALNRLSKAGAEIDFRNLSVSLSDLKCIWLCGRTAPFTRMFGKTAASALPAFFWRTAL